MKLEYTKKRDVKSPTRGTPASAGLDFYVPKTLDPITVAPQTDILIPTGICIDMRSQPIAFMAVNKSGVATSNDAKEAAGMHPGYHNTCLILGACLIDSDYQGEIWIHLINVGHKPTVIHPGEKLSQLICFPVLYPELQEVESFSTLETPRGTGGFGSTNRK